MRVAVPTEVKDNEFRVAITPVGVHELVAHGHEVVVQRGAGGGSRITDAGTSGRAPSSSTTPTRCGPARTWC